VSGDGIVIAGCYVEKSDGFARVTLDLTGCPFLPTTPRVIRGRIGIGMLGRRCLRRRGGGSTVRGLSAVVSSLGDRSWPCGRVGEILARPWQWRTCPAPAHCSRSEGSPRPSARRAPGRRPPGRSVPPSWADAFRRPAASSLRRLPARPGRHGSASRRSTPATGASRWGDSRSREDWSPKPDRIAFEGRRACRSRGRSVAGIPIGPSSGCSSRRHRSTRASCIRRSAGSWRVCFFP